MKKQSYFIYGLIDPRTNSLCYIGCTRRPMKIRLRQHNNVPLTQVSKIANLSKTLKRLGLSFSMIKICTCQSEQEMYDKEVYYISYFRRQGYNLRNIQLGGKLTVNEAECYKRASITKKSLRHTYVDQTGENHPMSKVSKDTVIEIYSFIKQGWNNEEIQSMYPTLNLSGLKALRSGQNWKDLWLEHLDVKIPSIPSQTNKYNTSYKLDLVEKLENGAPYTTVAEEFPLVSKADIKRIAEKKIWQKVWDLYYIVGAFKEQSLSKNTVNSGEA